MSAHALLSPSSAPRWMRCPGSVALSYGAPDGSSQYADEGTAAHTLAAQCLTSKQQSASASLGAFIPVMNDDGTVRASFQVDDEMADAIQVYVDAILREPGALLVEQRVDFSAAIGVPNQSGTADAIKLDYEAGILGVHDLKYGRGVKVYAGYRDDAGVPHPNEQLALYALGALHEHDLSAEWNTVRMCIHQPRIDHFDEFEMTVAELRAWGQEARAKAAEAMSVFKANGTPIPGADLSGMLNPGEKQCRFCKAADMCPVLRARNDALVFDALDEQPVNHEQAVEAVQRATEAPNLDNLPQPEDLELLEIFLTAARSRIQRELQAGHKVRGWKLVQGKKGARQWITNRVEDVEKLLKKMRLKADEIYTKKLVSPTQAEKLFKGTNKWEQFAEFITQSEGGEHVAPESDPRPAIEKADVTALLGDDSDLY